MTINQGDIYWIDSVEIDAIPSDIRHPYIVIQDNKDNHDDAIKTVMVCALTTNMQKLSIAGNVLLNVGEANLTKTSIVEVSKGATIDKSSLGDYIGTVTLTHYSGQKKSLLVK